jgi:hypothetical protein
VGPSVGLDDVEKLKNLDCREMNPGRPTCIPSQYRLSYPEWRSILACVKEERKRNSRDEQK